MDASWVARSASSEAEADAAWRASNSGRLERIGGRQVKLCAGGGDVVAHSSV